MIDLGRAAEDGDRFARQLVERAGARAGAAIAGDGRFDVGVELAHFFAELGDLVFQADDPLRLIVQRFDPPGVAEQDLVDLQRVAGPS